MSKEEKDLFIAVVNALKCTLDGANGYFSEHNGSQRYWKKGVLENAATVLKIAEELINK